MKLIKQGEILVNEILMMYDTPIFKLWEVDFHSKYVNASTVAINTYEIHFYADSYTIKIDDEHEGYSTVFEIDLDWHDWEVHTYTAKSQGYIVAWRKKPPEPETVSWVYQYEGDPCSRSSYCQED